MPCTHLALNLNLNHESRNLALTVLCLPHWLHSGTASHPISQVPAEDRLKPELQIPHPESRNPNHETRDWKPEFRVPNPEIRNPNTEYRILKPEYRIPKPEYRIPNTEYRILKPEWTHRANGSDPVLTPLPSWKLRVMRPCCVVRKAPSPHKERDREREKEREIETERE